MGLPSLSFVAGLLLLAYLSSFVLFAFIRVVTGVSIQRLGYAGLRRIAFTPKDGLRIELRGIKLTLHRPTFAQPTWLSVVLTELKVTVDLRPLGDKPRKRHNGWTHWSNGSAEKDGGNTSSSSEPSTEEDTQDDPGELDSQRSRTWETLTKAKEKIKRLHRKIKWIRLVDLVASTSTLVIVDVGSIQVGNFTMAVDTRRKTVDRTRLFQHQKSGTKGQSPAEWIFTVRSILFTPEGKDSTEVLDHCTLNVHGLLYQELDGLRDASIALKLGRLSLPYDDIKNSMDRAKVCRINHGHAHSVEPDISFVDVMEELDQPGSREENIVRTVSDSKEFAASILRGIQEIQFAVSFFGLTKEIQPLQCDDDSPMWMNISMKEVGMDLLRLDPRSPAHLMYFSRNDIAHQALIAAISISVGIDDGKHPERLLYVPMATTTVNTTLPSKTLQFSNEKNVAERNTNILFANLVVTSPSFDFDPKHLPLLTAFLHGSKHRPRPPARHHKRHLLSRLLPKANIKISIHEPVIRVTLPPMEPEKKGTDEFDLLIFAMSSASLDVESSHSADGDLHYSLLSTFRVNSNQLYYQTACSEKHNLLLIDGLELKLQLSASPEVVVVINGNLQTFSLYMVRPEISEGLHQIVAQLQSDMVRKRRAPIRHKQANFLRRWPAWLLHASFQGSDFNFEVAGVDPEVSKHARGFALHLESWTAEYKQNKADDTDARPQRRRAPSRTINRDDYLLRPSAPSSPRRKVGDSTDGRRLALHWHGLEGFVMEGADTWEVEPFLSLPRMEVAFTTSTDKQGPVFHVNSFAKSLYLHYSLYRHFSVGVAGLVLRRTFFRQPAHSNGLPTTPGAVRHLAVPSVDGDAVDPATGKRPEIVALDFKATFVQVKADMPSDPPLMLQIHSLEAGRHRWANPFLSSRLVRLYTETPNIKKVWSRFVSIKTLRLDYRQQKRKYGTTVSEDKSFDIVTDAIRLAVPHQLVLHEVFDNITNIVKTTEQLHHRFQTGSSDYMLDKPPQGPKHVPKVSLRSQALLFEIEDGSFDWKLGVIYRLGLLEQKQRLAREEAFCLKLKKLQAEDERSENSRRRAKSAHQARGRSKLRKEKESTVRHQSEGRSDRESPEESKGKDRFMRYNNEALAGLSGKSKTTAQHARERLDRLNAQTWKKRVDHGMSSQNRAMQDIRSIFWGLDELPDDIEQKETIMAIPQRPALMALIISDVEITLDKPSFPVQEYPKFLNRIGKGMPFDMQYSLLIPTHVKISMGEARVTLRDYPLPFLHVPAIRSGQSPRLPSLFMETDFVIAEEYRDVESSRTLRIVVVPPEKDDNGEDTGGFAVNVRRTVAPVKTYSDMNIEINSGYPTRITWGTSYQPAIQDMMQVIEGFTKQAIDPSERVGFWDKIRLTFHSRMNVVWKGDGDVHLILKGSRDPYSVTGQGAGFVMCWQNDVRWSICQDPDPRNFMIVNSGAYILAIPDLGHYARQEANPDGQSSESASSISSYKQNAVFRKTVMKLSGNVRWMSGLVFERNVDEGGRSFDFIPHYEVVLKHPDHAKPSNGKVYDAFRGFRSQHIHMSVAVSAPQDREWTVSNLEPSKNYNSVHLTPRFFTHFFSWWSMFSGVMSLPIRQGKLWPGVEKSSKKFGRHLATIKYSLLLSPLYMSHIYKHKDAEDYGSGVVSATGLKVRLDSFMLDLHQRREEFRTQVEAPKDQENLNQNQTTGMRINQAQLDFISADVRAVSASINGTNNSDLDTATEEMLVSYQDDHPSADLAKFTIPDNDWGWVDMDDFVELGWILPADRNPETKILPLAFAPRFTYFRQTDHQDHISGDIHRSSPFGHEPSHHCVMSARNDPRRVQCGLIELRLKKVSEQFEHNQRALDDQELRIVKEPDEKQEEAQRRLNLLREHNVTLQRKQALLQSMYDSLVQRLQENDLRASADARDDPGEEEFYEAREDYYDMDPDAKGLDSAPLADYISDFNNRFIIHNAHLKWSNSLRNIILRYIHQVSQRRGFVYYMSRRAVKFILDIVEEQKKFNQPAGAPTTPGTTSSFPLSPQEDDDLNIQDRVDQLLQDGKKFVAANDPVTAEGSKPAGSGGHMGDDIALEFTAQNTYHVRLIAPQIQLQSEKNTKAAVLVTAKGMQLKVIQIMDKDRVTDDVSGLVQRRFSAAMDSLQIFVTNAKTFTTEDLHMYSGSTYGTPAGSSWPPWVPFEVMFEFNTNPYGFQRVVQRTSASMRFDKYNTLRLKYNDDVSGGDTGPAKSPDTLEQRIDHLWIDFPHVRALCNSTQYYAMYIIVLDLLLYSEPLEKTRSERLEKIMLASDFSDLKGAPEMVISLQERIRQLEEIKMHFQVNEKYLDRQGWRDRITMEADLAVCEDELFFMMKAITTSQRKMDDRSQGKQSNGLLRWYISASEIVWHLLKENQESLAEFQLKNALYDRTDNNDGSNLNSMEIERIHGLNLLSYALYPEMIAPYIDNNRPFAEGRDTKMLRVHWLMLEAIAGIPVMDHFEVNLFPLKLQLEHEIGKKLFEYIFPGSKNDASPFLVKHMLPAQEEEDETEIGRGAPSQRSSNSQSLSSELTKNGDGGAGSLELRLQPTLNLEPSKPRTAKTTFSRPKSSGHGARPNPHHLRLFRESARSGSAMNLGRSWHPNRDMSSDNLSLASRPGSIRSNSNMSVATNSESDHAPKRFTLHRSTTASSKTASSKDKAARSDDITQMMERASSYMTLAYVKIPSMVLCLSYKGKGQRNFEDVHDLVFRMPTLEYRNKTWSNLDLALQLKKDVIRALISHTGAIIGNKFSRHQPTRQQQSRLRQIANSSTLLNTSPDLSGTSENNSMLDDISDASGETNGPRRSFTSGRGSVKSQSASQAESYDSSAHSLARRPGSSRSVNALGIEAEGMNFADELGRVDQTEPERAGVRGNLSRHLTGMGMGGAGRIRSMSVKSGGTTGTREEREGGDESEDT
ncbi:uncharacterized protein BDZ99DRAFT_405773 [Mytilinidion resinicola]|uniref:Mitochondrial protein from FMP27-domain-containing protein n=1 Tax=Mytilinidion resinicola TaxID=574789 RepID=A0A6A6ZCH4_9PEZI|nr:uncharacterized protein BDZ99DRAFT_405773 [Mytilinidion resinicola]KAF2818005.1 hypothetical protein BDZ99DRAFT_405773 [Mytilinidion resinicola]